MRRQTLLALAMFACLISLIVLYLTRDGPAPSLDRVAVWMPSSWDSSRARASWEANHAHIQEISPVWYQLDPSGDGSIIAYAGARDGGLVAEAHADGVLVIPLINNHYEGTGFDAAPVSTMLHDPARRTAHVQVLVNEILVHDYDGIDIDYESLSGSEDREPFSLFVEELAAALDAHGKLLSVAIHPKTAEPGPWSGPQAQDWARIGAAADRFRVMTYAYHWSESDPGPIAPLWWMEDVIDLTTTTVPPAKVYVGIHLYGHDWSGSTATSLTWESVQQIIEAHGATRQWQEAEGWRQPVAEPWFIYTDDAGQQHEVWYADGESVAARIELVSRYGLGGIAMWRLGGEDPAIWSAIGGTLRPFGQSGSATP